MAQSNSDFLNGGLLRMRVITYKTLKGGGRGKRAPQTSKESVKSKRSCVTIQSPDQKSCGYRAIAMGMKYHDLEVKKTGTRKNKQWRSLTTNEPQQRKIGQQLCREVGIDFKKEMTIELLWQIQQHYEGRYQIIVINFKTGDQIFIGPDAEKEIFLLFDPYEKHYDLIKEMFSYLGRDNYCKYCNKAYQKPIDHMCPSGCRLCRSPNQCDTDGQFSYCNQCNKIFKSNNCFKQHKDNGVCKFSKFCDNCESEYNQRTSRPHKCGEYYCSTCGEYYEEQPHQCFLRKLKDEDLIKDDKKNNIIVAFDIESKLVPESELTVLHEPILLVANIACNECWTSSGKVGDCVVCGEREKVFYGEDCAKQFNNFVIIDIAKRAQSAKGYVTCIAHNFSGYDGHFVFKDLCARNLKDPEPIFNGTKLMKLDIGNIRFIDSLLLFQRPLADLPKMFGLEEEVKGFFPHYLNTDENQNYQSLIKEIPKEKFGYNQMSSKRGKDFDSWYGRNSETQFNLKESMITYCKSDVSILMKAVQSFRQLFKETTDIDPLTRTFTLASIGLEFFRAKILEEKSIGITPIRGYSVGRKQSYEGKAWLDIMQEKYDKEIKREYRLGPYFADGHIDQTVMIDGYTYSGVSFEFLGCYWHGCDECGAGDREKLAAVVKRRQYYQKNGGKAIFIKECEWKSYVEERGRNYDPELAAKYLERYNYHKTKHIQDRYAIPRKALHGGRTNNIKFSYTVNPESDESLMYLDFTSLYPYVLSRREFPFGHPKVITTDFEDLSEYFGFISCRVLPPKQLYLPVLPMSCDGKLLFPLCRTCARSKNQDSCTCDDDARCLSGTYTSVELNKAVQLGYQVVEVYEVLHFEQRNAEMFNNYIKRWYKLKAEASGWPVGVESEEDKENYLEEFKHREGIELEAERIQVNSGLRSISKLMLNTLWGKLAQRPNMPQTKIVKKYKDLFELFGNPKIETLAEELIHDSIIISYRYIDDESAKPGNTAVSIACFVTAYARLKLYEELELLNDSNPGCVLYYDTDSIIFVHKAGRYLPKIENFLGEMTDEITGEYGAGAKMIEFHTIGPKCYSYKVLKPDQSVETKFKAKGITQTVESREVCNFNEIRRKAMNAVYDIRLEKTLVPQQQFRANKQQEVRTRKMIKELNVTSNKRRIIGNDTLPYGYVDEEEGGDGEANAEDGQLDFEGLEVDEGDEDVDGFAAMMAELID